MGRFASAPAGRCGFAPELKYAAWDALTYNQLNAYPMVAAAAWKPAASPIAVGSLNVWNPIAESASCRYVERNAVNAVGTPPTNAVCVTRPYLVRYVTREYEPAGVESAVLGVHALSW